MASGVGTSIPVSQLRCARGTCVERSSVARHTLGEVVAPRGSAVPSLPGFTSQGKCGWEKALSADQTSPVTRYIEGKNRNRKTQFSQNRPPMTRARIMEVMMMMMMTMVLARQLGEAPGYAS